MKKIAIISPSTLPIPAVKGGAIETLINYFVDINEEKKDFLIDVYSIFDVSAKKKSNNYECSNFKYINKNIFDKIYDKFCFYIRVLSNESIIFPTSYIIKTTKLLSTNKYDAVIVEGEPEVILRIKNKFKNTILHIHTDILNESRKYYKKVIDTNINIIAVSNFIKKSIDYKKTTVVLNCADERLFTNNYNNDIRKSLGVNNDDILVVFSGRIDESKGIDVLIDSILDINNTNIKLLVIGASWFSSNKKTNFNKMLLNKIKNKEDRIIFTGYIEHSEIAKYYSCADVCVVPSRCNDAAPLVSIEMQMCKVKTIGTNRGGIPEYILEKSNIVELDKNEIKNKILENISYNKNINYFYRDRYDYYNDISNFISNIISGE